MATPIGNLEDISLRALRILREVKRIAAEDTRRTRKLLSFYDIHTPIISFYEHRQREKIPLLLNLLQEGDIALVSDAGTPGINDPGYELVCAALAQGIKVSPIPGPCAPIAALVASGLPAESFLYLGYLPRKNNLREKFLQSIAHHPYTLIFLETPQRLIAALEMMQKILGNRQLTVAREMTKLHEEFFYGTIEEALAYYQTQGTRGEFTLVVAGSNQHPKHSNMEGKAGGMDDLTEHQPWQAEKVLRALQELSQQGWSLSQSAKHIAQRSGWHKKDIYRLASEAKNQQGSIEVKNESR